MTTLFAFGCNFPKRNSKVNSQCSRIIRKVERKATDATTKHVAAVMEGDDAIKGMTRSKR
jgi:hypothetical protein